MKRFFLLIIILFLSGEITFYGDDIILVKKK